MVVLFPVGSILMRIVPGRFAVWAHALFQLMAYILYIAGAALGIYLVKTVNIPFAGGNLLTNSRTNYHPILGLVVLATLFLQPMLGYIHHVRFKQLGRRTVWSHLHLWNGRIGITVGIIDGGLGLQLANAPRRIKTAYIAVAVILWSLWMLVAIANETRRARRAPAGTAAAAAAGRGGSAGYYAARRSHTPDPEMSAARTVGTPGTGSSRSSPPPARPPRSGNRSPKSYEEMIV
ncbi:integral membrane protein [Ophiostoma piceae UAMH 11346]|uniref:Integral membrane protein n=1 Tax=Ophiostoma piceae (strain UAMH 11346) TaxID=1262450 RepID=S3CHV0_OPHP1|nr:integral membrane protein [Ophiostoma piceae UAMH 11346]